MHKESIAVGVADGNGGGEIRYFGEIQNIAEAITKLIKQLRIDKTNLVFCYEAEPCGYEIHRQITELGWECQVVAPSLIPKKAGDRVKIVLIPFMVKFWLYQQAKGHNVSVFAKFGLALILLGVGYWVLVPEAKVGVTGTKVSFMFLTLTYFVHTVAELLLSPVGLSTFSRLAPERFTSQLMDFWFVAASLDNLLAGLLVAGMNTENPNGLPDAFNQVFIISAVFGSLLLLLAKPITKWALGGKEKVAENVPSH